MTDTFHSTILAPSGEGVAYGQNHRPYGQAFLSLDRYSAVSPGGQNALLALRLRLRDGASGIRCRPQARGLSKLRLSDARSVGQASHNPRDDEASCVSLMGLHENALQQPEHGRLPCLWRSRHQGLRRVERQFRALLGRHGANVAQRPYARKNQRQWSLRAFQLFLGDAEGASRQQKNGATYRYAGG